MKKNLLAVLAIASLLALLLVGVYELVLTPEGETFSESENRLLATRPGLSLSAWKSGAFAEGLEAYLADHFPGRRRLIAWSQDLRQVGSLATWEDYARVSEDEGQVMDYGALAEQTAAAVTPRPTAQPTAVPPLTPQPDAAASPAPATATPRPTKEPVDLTAWPRELHFYLMDGDKKSAGITKSQGELLRQGQLLSAYASLLPENGRLVMTVAPLSSRAARLQSYADPQGMTSEIEPFLHAVTPENVSVISAADLLSEPLLRGEYVYFRSDRHWTPYGAYLVVSRLMEEVGQSLPDYDAFPKQQEYPFLGTVYRDTRNKRLMQNPDTLDLLTPLHPVEVRRYSAPNKYEVVPFIDENAKQEDRYACYLGGPHGQLTVVTRTDLPADAQPKTCCMITDSFGLCTVSYFLCCYDRVIIYDPRYYDKALMGSLSQTIEGYGVQDIFAVAGEVDLYDSVYLNLLNQHF